MFKLFYILYSCLCYMSKYALFCYNIQWRLVTGSGNHFRKYWCYWKKYLTSYEKLILWNPIIIAKSSCHNYFSCVLLNFLCHSSKYLNFWCVFSKCISRKTSKKYIFLKIFWDEKFPKIMFVTVLVTCLSYASLASFVLKCPHTLFTNHFYTLYVFISCNDGRAFVSHFDVSCQSALLLYPY